jgi:hypothetical protein
VGLKVAFLLVTFMVAGSVGVKVAATGPLRPLLTFWCKKSGIRYSGVTAQGGPVCFTLTPDGTGLREIGYTFVPKNRCPESSNYVGPMNPPFEVHGGRINLQGVGLLFRGRIVGSTASGVLSDRDACPGQRVQWTAYRLTRPQNTSPSTISGTPQDGETLTANTGTWQGAPPPRFTFRWRRCDATAANCVAIAGASAQTYVPSASDVGSTLRVSITATNTAGAATAVSRPTEVVLGPQPNNTALPTVSGTAQAAQTLTATAGTWTGLPASFSYQWQRCDATGANCANIPAICTPGASTCAAPTVTTGQSYLASWRDVGSTIRVTVTAQNALGTASASSTATAVVTSAPPNLAPRETSPPTISGTPQTGETLTATPGSWTNNPTSFEFVWQECDATGTTCGALPIHPSPTYVIRSTDLDHQIRVCVVAYNAAGGGEGPCSSQTTAVT